MVPYRSTAAAALALCVAACSPTLNWREIRPEGSGALAMFPCRPSHEVRPVPLAGAKVRLAIASCKAGDVMFALSYADVGDATRVGPALVALRVAAVGNMSGAVVSSHDLQVEGMTPHAESQAIELKGKLPDGRPMQERLAFFTKGSEVYQATMFGTVLDAEATESFFGALRLP